MNKLLHIAFLILVTNLWGLLAAQAQTTPLGKIIANETERAQFMTDMKAYTKADFALRTIIDPDSNMNRKWSGWRGTVINQMNPSFSKLSQFSIKVTNFTMRENRENPAFYQEVDLAFIRGRKAGKEEGTAKINTITNEADFVSKVNEYVRILEEFENGKFGEIIRAAEK